MNDLPAIQESQGFLDLGGAFSSLGEAFERYEINQDTGKIKYSDGEIEKIPIVLIAMRRYRINLTPYDPAKKSEILCKSDDFIRSTDDYGSLICSDCELSQWKKDKKGKDIKPVCMEIYQIIAWDTQRECPFSLNIKRKGISSLRKLKRILVSSSYKYKKQGIRPEYCMTLDLFTAKETYGKNSYYLPDFSNPQEVEKSLAQLIQENASVFVEMAIKYKEDVKTEEKEYSSESQDRKEEKKFSLHLPDVENPNWGKEVVGFKKTGNLTWEDLANDCLLPDGRKGRRYLHGLAAIKDNKEIAEVAQMALQLQYNSKKTEKEEVFEIEDEPPF